MADVADNILEFIPWKSVGKFELNSDIKNYQFPKQNWEYGEKDEFGDEFYRATDNSLTISFQNNKVHNIFCYETLIYQGVNLIGLTIDEFKNITQSDYVGDVDVLDFEDDGYPQSVYEFEDIGAQVWEKQGKIVCIIVADKESYSDEPFDN